MNSRLVIDKTVYFLVGSMLVGLLVFSGCGSTDEEVSEEVVVEQIDSEATFVEEDEAGEPPFVQTTTEDEAETLPSDASPQSSATTVVTTETTVESTFVYEDGAYTQTGSYQSPAGSESVTVTITVQDDVVTAVTVTPNATNGTSKNYQDLFVSGVNSLVVGKPLSEVGSLGPVNGSSLTPKGFNAALSAIKSDASL